LASITEGLIQVLYSKTDSTEKYSIPGWEGDFYRYRFEHTMVFNLKGGDFIVTPVVTKTVSKVTSG
jgi:hypothetical protein